MRRKTPFILAALLSFVSATLAVALFATAAKADGRVAITDLTKEAKVHDGEEVTVVGEAVGDLMVRGNHAWMTVNDDAYSKKGIEEGGELVGMSNAGIGVWAPTDETDGITTLGGYKKKGDIVKVTGTFHRACREHGGDTDLHAVRVEVLTKGYSFDHRFSYPKLLTATVLALAGATLWYLWQNKKKKALRKAGWRDSGARQAQYGE